MFAKLRLAQLQSMYVFVSVVMQLATVTSMADLL